MKVSHEIVRRLPLLLLVFIGIVYFIPAQALKIFFVNPYFQSVNLTVHIKYKGSRFVFFWPPQIVHGSGNLILYFSVPANTTLVKDFPDQIAVSGGGWSVPIYEFKVFSDPVDKPCDDIPFTPAQPGDTQKLWIYPLNPVTGCSVVKNSPPPTMPIETPAPANPDKPTWGITPPQ